MKVLWLFSRSDNVTGAPASKYGDWKHPLLSEETLSVVLNDLSYMDDEEKLPLDEVLARLLKGETVELENGAKLSNLCCSLLFENESDELWEISINDWKELENETERVSKLSNEELRTELLKFLSEKYPGISPEHSWP